MNAPFDPRTLINDAVSRAACSPDRRRPLTRDLPPAVPFPVAALGPLQRAAEAIHDATRAPVAIGAQSVLAAATLAVQPHRDVELPGGGRKPLTGLFATIAESGERKSACDRLALAPVRAYENRLRDEHGPACASFASDMRAWKAATDQAEKRGKGNRAVIRAALEEIGPAPVAPPGPMVIVSDPTPEALTMQLASGRPWAALFTDEGGTFIGGHGMNDENRMKTGALLNTLWDGEPIRRTRIGTGVTFLPGRRCSVHVMMQPIVAEKFFGDATMGGLGTLARFLTVAPETTAGTRMFAEQGRATPLHLADFNVRIAVLLNLPLPMTPGDSGALDPKPMRLDIKARNAWIAFHDEAERAIAGSFALIRPFAAKLAEHAGRLAAVLATYADPDTMTVTGEHMASGIELARHYAAELLRIGEASQVPPDLILADQLRAWWEVRPDPSVHLAMIYQLGPNRLREAATAKRIVAVLEDHGFVERLTAGTVVDGARRRDAWTLRG